MPFCSVSRPEAVGTVVVLPFSNILYTIAYGRKVLLRYLRNNLQTNIEFVQVNDTWGGIECTFISVHLSYFNISTATEHILWLSYLSFRGRYAMLLSGSFPPRHSNGNFNSYLQDNLITIQLEYKIIF